MLYLTNNCSYRLGFGWGGNTCGAGFYMHALVTTALFMIAIKLSYFVLFCKLRINFRQSKSSCYS